MNPLLAVSRSRGAILLLGLALAGCSSLDNLMSGDKIDYRSQATRTQGLDVPPDLSQLARDNRYQQLQQGVVSAAAMKQQGVVAAPVATVAPNSIGDLRIMRDGETRWLHSSQSPEALFPQLRSFWQESGFVLVVDDPKIGLLETDWAENRAKLPNDIIRRTLGKVFDNLWSTSELDRFRTRVERAAGGGTDIFISYRGMEEIYTDKRQETTVWQPRPPNPDLEAEFLSRLMVKLGGGEATARAEVAATAPAAAARKTGPASLPANAVMDLDVDFDRAWRQVGLALDRSGFTVEDRDRTAGLYFVRYVDPKLAGKEEPGFFSKLFKGEKELRPVRYRVLVKSSGAKSRVSVENNLGQADNSEPARQIVARLIDELK